MKTYLLSLPVPRWRDAAFVSMMLLAGIGFGAWLADGRVKAVLEDHIASGPHDDVEARLRRVESAFADFSDRHGRFARGESDYVSGADLTEFPTLRDLRDGRERLRRVEQLLGIPERVEMMPAPVDAEPSSGPR